MVLSLFLSGCEAAAADRKAFEVFCFLNVPTLADWDKDVGLSLVVVGLFRLEREVVGLFTLEREVLGLSTPDLCDMVDALRSDVGPVARDDIGVARPVLSADVTVRDEVEEVKPGLSFVPVVRDVFKELLSDLALFRAGLDEVVELRSALSADIWSVAELTDILLGLAASPTSSYVDSFSVVSALLSTEGRFACEAEAEAD